MLLHVGCRILSSNLALEFNDHAKLFLSCFVLFSGVLYGPENHVLNMHSLIHLADDAKYFKAPISSFTAFAFENTLGKMKKMLRSGNRPLPQICRRLHEQFIANTTQIKNVDTQSDVEIISSRFIDKEKKKMFVKKLRYKNMILTIEGANNTVLLENSEILQLQRIEATTDLKIIKITGTHLKKIKPAFTYPCNSAALGIWITKKVNLSTTTTLDKIINKMVTFNIATEKREKLYTFPLLHNI